MTSHRKVFQIIILAFFSAITFVGKIVLQPWSNIELVTFFLIIFTMIFTLKEALGISSVYTIVEIMLWGLSEQFYIWTLIVLITFLLKKIFKENFILWSLLAAFFGITFGFFSAIPIFILTGLPTAISYYLAGIIFDVNHMIFNYVFMLLFGEIVYNKLQILIKEYYH